MKKYILFALLISCFISYSQPSYRVVNSGIFYAVQRLITPGVSVYKDVIKIVQDSMRFKQKNVYWDSIPSGNGDVMTSGAMLKWVDPVSKKQKYTSLSTVPFSSLFGAPIMNNYVLSVDFTWANLAVKPTTFTPGFHMHSISEVIQLQDSLNNKPTFTQIQNYFSAFSSTFSPLWVSISGKPLTFTPSAHTHPISDVIALQDSLNIRCTKSQIDNLFSGFQSTLNLSWSSIIGKPSFASVATSGSYSDLIGAPTITAPVNADWNSSTGFSQVLNKPLLFSGAYTDLTGKPTLFSGSYTDLTNTPTIPSAQVTQTMIAGTNMSITTGVNTFTFTNTSPDQVISLTAGKNTTITGTYPNFMIAAIKSTISYTGTTGGSGTYSVVYPTSYAKIPIVNASIRNQSNPNQQVLLTSSTVNGFTLTAYQKNSVTLLAVDVLLSTNVTVNSLIVDVAVSEQ